MKGSLRSDCCGAAVKTETWISKVTRRVRDCEKCGKPCRTVKEAVPVDKKVSTSRFIYFFVV